MEKKEQKEIKSEKKDEKSEINYFLYENEPEKLFPLAQEQFNKNKFEEGLEILEQSIIIAIKKYGGEDKIELAQFYNKYSDGLIQKLIMSNEDFLNLQEEDQPKEEGNTKKENEINTNKKIENEEDDKSDTKKNKEIGDDEVVYENLNAANLLLKNYLKQYDDKDPKSLDQSILKYYKQLSINYSLFASLEKINSDFKKADEYFKLSINIAKKYDNKFSRNLAGLYFERAQILDFDPQNCMISLFKSKIIMEHYLQEEINKTNLKIKLDIDETDLDLENLSYESDKIFKNKNIIDNNTELINAAKENCDIEEFINIIKDINIKLEDVILELKEYNLFLKTKEQMKKDGEKQNCFDKNIDMSKVVDLSKVTLIKKKRREPSGNNDDIKIPEELNSKEKKKD